MPRRHLGESRILFPLTTILEGVQRDRRPLVACDFLPPWALRRTRNCCGIGLFSLWGTFCGICVTAPVQPEFAVTPPECRVNSTPLRVLGGITAHVVSKAAP